MKKSKLILMFVVAGFALSAFADAPVEDYSTDVNQAEAPPPIVSQPAASQPPAVSGTVTTAPAPAMQSQPQDFSSEQSFSKSPANQSKSSANEAAAVTHADTSNLTLEERIGRLERQIDNINQVNSQGRIDDLQQQLQKISGDLEIQTHNLQELQDQVHSLYKDLDQRIGGAGAGAGAAKATGSSSALNKTTDEDDLAGIVNNDKASAKTIAKSTTTTTTTTTKNQDPDAAAKEQQNYQSGFEFLQNKKYDDATKKLKGYLAAYPKGAYASNAHYWLGEINFMQKHYSGAATEFDTVIKQYADSPKVPEAMLKLALIHENQGKHDQAQTELKQLKKKYPKSAAAKLADQQLQLMN